jgi:large subunit ribosomal protein L30
MANLLAVVRVRGVRNIEPRIKKTLEHLRLNRPNHCVVVRPTDSILGMLEKVKDYVTFGEISEEILFELLLKRGERGKKALRSIKSEEEIKNIVKEIIAGKKISEFVDPVFRLHPPRKGYKNVKLHYPRGALGRRESMDDLIKRMI